MITFEAKDVINPTAFKEVLLIGGVKGATVRLAKDKGLLVLVLRIGEENRILGQYRGGARYFRTVDRAACRNTGQQLWRVIDTTAVERRTK